MIIQKGDFMKSGFTMVEVLITLGIIGIIAAMTLPTVITNYKKMRTLTVLKRAYADISNLFLDFKTDTGCYDYLNNCFPGWGEFRDEFAKYLHNKRGFHDKFSVYNAQIPINRLEGGYGGLRSYYPTNIEESQNRLLVAPNGTYILGLELNQDDNYYQLDNNGLANPPNYFRAMIFIYTDPNMVRWVLDKKATKNTPTLGKEIFNLFIMADGQIIPNGSSKCSVISSWNYHCQNWEVMQTCNKDNTYYRNGYGCLARIIGDGWQIKYY